MNGRSPAATSPMSPWTNYAPSSPTNTPLQHLPNNTKSPSVQHDSLITMLEPRRSEVHHFQGRCPGRRTTKPKRHWKPVDTIRSRRMAMNDEDFWDDLLGH